MTTIRGGLLLLTAGLVLTLLARDNRLGLVIALTGVTLLAYGVLSPYLPGTAAEKEPPAL